MQPSRSTSPLPLFLRAGLGVSFVLGGCSTQGPYAELVDAGIADYLGEAVVSETSRDEGITTYTFDSDSGPMCIRGDPYSVSVRPQPSDDLLVFLQGGGACWSEFCLSVELADRGFPGTLEVLDTSLDYNPVAHADVLYVPYCDGSLFAGDIDIDEDGDGEIDRYHRGLRNLSAALDIAADRFADPERIILAGSSAGGFGTILATVVLRSVYPGVPMYVISDSGVGVARGAAEPAFAEELLDEWNARRFLPESCSDCLADGHLTPLVAWELEQDANLKVGVFSSYRDWLVTRVFLVVDPEDFEDDLRGETSAIADAFPGRYAPFLIEGEAHTTMLGNVTGVMGEDYELAESLDGMVDLGSMTTSKVDGVDFATWMARMLNDSPAWGPLRE